MSLWNRVSRIEEKQVLGSNPGQVTVMAGPFVRAITPDAEGVILGVPCTDEESDQRGGGEEWRAHLTPEQLAMINPHVDPCLVILPQKESLEVARWCETGKVDYELVNNPRDQRTVADPSIVSF